jgi:hypothetical protein
LRQIAVDAGGWVWILPIQPEALREEVEVIRINVTSGVERLDTVPFFPTEFLPGGGFIAAALDSLGVPMLRRALPTQRP